MRDDFVDDSAGIEAHPGRIESDRAVESLREGVRGCPWTRLGRFLNLSRCFTTFGALCRIPPPAGTFARSASSFARATSPFTRRPGESTSGNETCFPPRNPR